MDPSKGHLVPETLLKRRHDLDELRAKHAAQALVRQGNTNRKKIDRSSTNRALIKLKVRKPESFLKNRKQKTNMQIRFDRVKKGGMHSQATDKIDLSVQLIDPASVDGDGDADMDNDETKDKTVQMNARLKDPSRYPTDESIMTELTRRYRGREVSSFSRLNSVGAKVVLVVRVADGIGCPTSCRKVLTSFRLREPWEAVLLRYDASTAKRLKLVEPYVAYGIPTRDLVSDLVTRRGYGIEVEAEAGADGTITLGKSPVPKRVALKDNVVVEKALGDPHGIICVEDLVHQLHSCGGAFAPCSKFLWPFRLAAPRSKYQRDTLKHLEKRADYGDMGGAIVDFAKNML